MCLSGSGQVSPGHNYPLLSALLPTPPTPPCPYHPLPSEGLVSDFWGLPAVCGESSGPLLLQRGLWPFPRRNASRRRRSPFCHSESGQVRSGQVTITPFIRSSANTTKRPVISWSSSRDLVPLLPEWVRSAEVTITDPLHSLCCQHQQPPWFFVDSYFVIFTL